MSATRIVKVCEKDPDETLDFGFTWTDWLATHDDVIVGSTWEVPAGLSLELEEVGSQVTAVWISGGTLGQQYVLVNQIETDSDPPRKPKRAMTLRIVDRGA